MSLDQVTEGRGVALLRSTQRGAGRSELIATSEVVPLPRHGGDLGFSTRKDGLERGLVEERRRPAILRPAAVELAGEGAEPADAPVGVGDHEDAEHLAGLGAEAWCEGGLECLSRETCEWMW